MICIIDYHFAAIIFTSSFYVAYRERKIDKRQAVRPIGSP